MDEQQMRTWYPLRSQAEWRQFDDLVAGFHDGVIKEMRWSHGEYVNTSFEMVYTGKPSLWILVQLQLSEVPTVEMRFIGVSECSISAARDLEVNLNFEVHAIEFTFSSDGRDRVVAEKCEYRFGGLDLLGPGPFWNTY